MNDLRIDTVRADDQIALFAEMVWEFFDLLRMRYAEMVGEIDTYITTTTSPVNWPTSETTTTLLWAKLSSRGTKELAWVSASCDRTLAEGAK